MSMDSVEGGAPLSKIIEDASQKVRHITLDESDCKYILYAMVRLLYLLNKDRQLLGHIDPTTIYCFDNGMIKIAGMPINYTDAISKLPASQNGSNVLSYLSPEMLTSKDATYTTTTEIWQLGCLAYELAMRKPLIEAPDYLRKLMEHQEVPQALRHSGKSKEF